MLKFFKSIVFMANKKLNLRIPGPTPLPSSVLKAVSQQMINHRASKYEEMQKRIIENLKHFFGTENEIYLLTSSGMGGLEAAIVNFFSTNNSNGQIVSLTCGEFGNRWAEIVRRYKLDIAQIKSPPGKEVDLVELGRVLREETNVDAVLVTLNETSTGVLNSIKEVASLVHKHKNDPLILVDAISALGAVDLPMDALGIDVLVTASQKAWMSPPGIAMIAVSKKAWERSSSSDLPKYYFDLKMYREYNQKNQTPATPAVATLFGLDCALQLMMKEGKENIFKRHLLLRDYFRNEIRKLGLELFVDDDFASPTVTSIKLPDGVDGHTWISVLRDKYNVVIAGGMGDTKGKIIRVAHMGYVHKSDLERVVDSLKRSLKELV